MCLSSSSAIKTKIKRKKTSPRKTRKNRSRLSFSSETNKTRGNYLIKKRTKIFSSLFRFKGKRTTFNDLAAVCEKNFYKLAVIAENHRIAVVRSFDTAQIQLKSLKMFFGKRLVSQITTESLNDGYAGAKLFSMAVLARANRQALADARKEKRKQTVGRTAFGIARMFRDGKQSNTPSAVLRVRELRRNKRAANRNCF